MLKIYYGNMPEAVFNTSVYFKNVNERNKIFNASTCGDNCAKWILRLAETEDLTTNLRHLMNFGSGTFEICILNINQIVHTMKELVPIAGLYV
ncbi:MAG: DUF4869 domain-containing protein [Lachnospiraceae bacterium]